MLIDIQATSKSCIQLLGLEAPCATESYSCNETSSRTLVSHLSEDCSALVTRVGDLLAGAAGGAHDLDDVLSLQHVALLEVVAEPAPVRLLAARGLERVEYHRRFVRRLSAIFQRSFSAAADSPIV